MKEEQAREAIKKNIERANKKVAAALTTRAAYLCDAASRISNELSEIYSDVFDGVCTGETAREIYAKHRAVVESEISLSEELNKSERYALRGMKIYDSCFICSMIYDKKHTTEEAARAFFGAETIVRGGTEDAKIAFVAGKQANAAFEKFAKFLGSASAVSVDSFSDACDAASDGEADYCIVPLENSAEGRLDGFFNTVGKAGLYPLVACRCGDGENYTRFALFSRKALYAETEGENIMQLRITVDKTSDVTDVLCAADFFGAEAIRVDTVPLSAAGRENSLDIVFNVKNADVSGFITFMRFEYPQFYMFGIYTDISEGDKK